MAAVIPTYFEVSSSVISTIGLFNILVGVMVIGITDTFPVVVVVPMVVSAACALANGLSYVAYIAVYPIVNTSVARAFTGFFWTVQEAGLPFYGYLILRPILRGGERIIFQTLFWSLMIIVVTLRFAALVIEPVYTLQHKISLDVYQSSTRNLGVTCFVAIALIELTSAVFLLRNFRAGLKASTTSPPRGGQLFRYLMRSTEIRVTSLALIGITRAATYSFHAIGSGATEGVANQLDRLMVIMQALFPIVMFIDIIASRLVEAHESNARNNSLDDVHVDVIETKVVAIQKTSSLD